MGARRSVLITSVLMRKVRGAGAPERSTTATGIEGSGKGIDPLRFTPFRLSSNTTHMDEDELVLPGGDSEEEDFGDEEGETCCLSCSKTLDLCTCFD